MVKDGSKVCHKRMFVYLKAREAPGSRGGGGVLALSTCCDFTPFVMGNASYVKFYHGYCVDQRKAASIILQQTHGYWKIDAASLYTPRVNL
jgi:hypothetical protein